MDSLPVGPYRTLTLSDGTSVPFYVLPFDRKGRCEGPSTRSKLLQQVQDEQYTDIFLFAHGWNNDWKDATQRYEHFLAGFSNMRDHHHLEIDRPYKPLLVGVHWPSSILVAPGDEAPQIAAGDPEAIDQAVASEREQVRELAEDIPDSKVEDFYRLCQKQNLTEEEALELANILQSLYRGNETDDISGIRPPDPTELVAAWKAISAKSSQEVSDEDYGGATSTGDAAQAAGVLSDIALRARDVVRGFTVWQMKDRAATVGGSGIADLLIELLSSGRGRLHLIGHSYGAKVMMSAICAPNELPRQVDSLLLLQPAVSHLCFAEEVPGGGTGGYRSSLARVTKPILTTFSAKDAPLTKFFHLALRRHVDKGELKIAAVGEPPSVFAALGGFGPRGSGEQLIPIKELKDHYALGSGAPDLYGLDGSATIAGHSDISNESTWWALYELVRA